MQCLVAIHSNGGAVHDKRVFPRRIDTLAKLLIVVAAAASAAHAQETNYAPVAPFSPAGAYFDLHSAAMYTDNVSRTSGAQSSDTLVSVGTDLNLHRHGSRLNLDAEGDLDWVQFLRNSYGGRAFGYFDGTALWGKPTEVFQWLLRDSFGQLLSDPLAAATPATLENVNYLSTGPTVNLPFGSRTRLSLNGVYSNTTYEKSNFDSHSLQTGASLSRQVSAISTVSLNAATQKTQFLDRVDYSDFDSQQYYVGYTAEGRRTTALINLGYRLLREHNPDTTHGGLLVQVQLGRRISPSSSVYVSGREQYVAAEDALRGGFTPRAQPGTAVNVASSAPYRERLFEGGWRFDRSRTSFSLFASRTEDNYDRQASLDRSTTAFTGSVEHRLSSTVNLALTARTYSVDYTTLGKYDERAFSAVLSKIFGRLSVALDYERYDRTGSGAIEGYRENRIGARLKYGFGHGALGLPEIR